MVFCQMHHSDHMHTVNWLKIGKRKIFPPENMRFYVFVPPPKKKKTKKKKKNKQTKKSQKKKKKTLSVAKQPLQNVDKLKFMNMRSYCYYVQYSDTVLIHGNYWKNNWRVISVCQYKATMPSNGHKFLVFKRIPLSRMFRMYSVF